MNIKSKLFLGAAFFSTLSCSYSFPNFNNPLPFMAKKNQQTHPIGQEKIKEAGEYENLRSTSISPSTVEIVKIINGIKSDPRNPMRAQGEVLEKLCGNSLLRKGYFQKSNGASCRVTPHSAAIPLFICGDYPKFEATPCAKEAKKLLWPGQENMPLSYLQNVPIKKIAVSQIGVDEFKSKFDSNSDDKPRTLSEEMQYYANPTRISNEGLAVYQMSNLRYILCKSKRENLPQNMRILANETCHLEPLKGVGKTELPESQMLKQRAELVMDPNAPQALKAFKYSESPNKTGNTPQERQNSFEYDHLPVRPALKNLEDNRPLDRDDPRSFSDATKGLIDEIKRPQRPLIPAPKQGFKGKELVSEPSLIGIESSPDTALTNLEVHLNLVEKDFQSSQNRVNAANDRELRSIAGKLLSLLDKVENIVMQPESLNDGNVERVKKSYQKIISLANRLYTVLDDNSKESLKQRLAKHKIIYDQQRGFYQVLSAAQAPAVSAPKIPAWMTDQDRLKRIEQRRMGQ